MEVQVWITINYLIFNHIETSFKQPIRSIRINLRVIQLYQVIVVRVVGCVIIVQGVVQVRLGVQFRVVVIVLDDAVVCAVVQVIAGWR